MSDLCDKNGELLISPGECWDRLLILHIKSLWINNPDKQEVAAKEWMRTQHLIHNIHVAGHVPSSWRLLLLLLDKLEDQNRIQWACEDKVRTEQSWQAAKEARDSNTVRVSIKNEINALYGYCEDQKEYAGE